MYRYAILNNELRKLELPSGDTVPSEIIDTHEKWKSPTYPYIVNMSRGFEEWNSPMRSMDMMFNCSKYPKNKDQVQALKDEIVQGKYTSIKKVYPTIRTQLFYSITDKNGTVMEEGSKVRINSMNSALKLLPIAEDDSQEYSDVVYTKDAIDLTINVESLGISKNLTSGEYNLNINDIAFSIALCDENVTDSYMTAMQQKIGWSLNSITQEELGNYYYTIYQASVEDPQWNPIVVSSIRKYTKLFINVSSLHDVFANVHDCKEIEDLVIENEKRAIKYKIETTLDGVALDPIKEIVYGSYQEVTAQIDGVIDHVIVVDKNPDVDYAVAFVPDETYYDENGDIHKYMPITDADGVTLTYIHNNVGAATVEVSIDAVKSNYTVEIVSAPKPVDTPTDEDNTETGEEASDTPVADPENPDSGSESTETDPGASEGSGGTEVTNPDEGGSDVTGSGSGSDTTADSPETSEDPVEP